MKKSEMIITTIAMVAFSVYMIVFFINMIITNAADEPTTLYPETDGTIEIIDLGKEVEDAVEEVPEEDLQNYIGDDTIEYQGSKLVKYETPDAYYDGLDYNSMQPYMSYKKITSRISPAYAVVHSEDAYTDDCGYRRISTPDTEFKVNGEDDYVIALGNYYKAKGVVGERYLIVTTTGAYTATTGDEKDDRDTDDYRMFHVHSGNKVSVVEWIVDSDLLETSVRRGGSVKYSSNTVISGDILYIYKIEKGGIAL